MSKKPKKIDHTVPPFRIKEHGHQHIHALAPNPPDVGKFTIIYEPRETCTLKADLGDPDDCSGGVYLISPAEGGKNDAIAKGCKLHLPRITATQITASFDQLSRFVQQYDVVDGKGVRKHHPKKDPDDKTEKLRPVVEREVLGQITVDVPNVIAFINNEFKTSVSDNTDAP